MLQLSCGKTNLTVKANRSIFAPQIYETDGTMPPKRKPDAEKKRNVINVRLDDALHETVRIAAAESGRSLSGEIQWRLEGYDSLQSAYALLSGNPEARRAAQIVAALADKVPEDTPNFRKHLERLIGIYFPKPTHGDIASIFEDYGRAGEVRFNFESDAESIAHRIGEIEGRMMVLKDFPTEDPAAWQKLFARKIEEQRAAVETMNDANKALLHGFLDALENMLESLKSTRDTEGETE